MIITWTATLRKFWCMYILGSMVNNQPKNVIEKQILKPVRMFFYKQFDLDQHWMSACLSEYLRGIHLQGRQLHQNGFEFLLKRDLCLGKILYLYRKPFSDWIWCTAKQTGSNRSCLPCIKWWAIYQVCPVSLR